MDRRRWRLMWRAVMEASRDGGRHWAVMTPWFSFDVWNRSGSGTNGFSRKEVVTGYELRWNYDPRCWETGGLFFRSARGDVDAMNADDLFFGKPPRRRRRRWREGPKIPGMIVETIEEEGIEPAAVRWNRGLR